MNVGLLGVGHIADQYVAGMARFANVQLVAVADRNDALGRERARQWGVRALAPDALVRDAAIDIVVNLTPPGAHAKTTTAALLAGKHVYSEKPLATTVADGRDLVRLAARQGLGLACAPDTLLGSAFQTAARVVREGLIGQPVAAHAFVGNSGPESWHPTPQDYYGRGGGPLFSLGPYYLSALVTILGPIECVEGFAAQPGADRVAPDGRQFPVSANTTYVGALRFASGAIATLFASYDVRISHVPPLEVYGEDATLALVDPNLFDGTVLIGDETGWRAVASAGAEGHGRGVGVADLAEAIAEGRSPRASATLALHVLDAMCALEEGGRERDVGLWPTHS